jgi:hypothetical protein
MSSSNVIKTGQPGRSSVAEYRYEALQGGTRSATPLAQAQFVAVGGVKRPPTGEPDANTHLADPNSLGSAEPIRSVGRVKGVAGEVLDRQLLEAFEMGVQEGRRQAEKQRAFLDELPLLKRGKQSK